MDLGIAEFEDWARSKEMDLASKPTTESKFMAYNFPEYIDPITKAAWEGYHAATVHWQRVCLPRYMAAMRVLSQNGLKEAFDKTCEEDDKLVQAWAERRRKR